MSNNKIHHEDSHQSILRSTSILSFGTFTSRILGFIRDIILAKFLGTGGQADAFFVALKIPNLFRSFIGEGATNAAVVPVLAEYRARGQKAEFGRFVSVVLVLAMIGLSVITAAGMFCAPLIVRLMAPGFMSDPAKLTLTVNLTRIMFPYLVLIGLTAYSMAVLFTFRSFTAPAFSPCLFNVAVITGALLSPRWMREPVYGLAFSVVAGGLLELSAQFRPILRQGLAWERPRTLRHPGAARIGKLLMPRLLGAGVYQLTVLFDTFCASLAAIVGTGGISAIYYANRIIQFPMGIFCLALASAILPSLSGLAADHKTQEFKKTLMFALENILYVIFPVTVLAMSFAGPVIRVLFQRGAFNAYSTAVTSSALYFYAAGLFSFSGIKILVSAFYALQDTRTPVKVAVFCLVINIVLNFILMFPMGIGGIALASSIAATVDFLALYYLLQKRIGRLGAGLRSFVLKIVAASLVMAAALQAEWRYLPFAWEAVKLAVVSITGILVYGIFTAVLGVAQTRQIWQWILRKR